MIRHSIWVSFHSLFKAYLLLVIGGNGQVVDDLGSVIEIRVIKAINTLVNVAWIAKEWCWVEARNTWFLYGRLNYFFVYVFLIKFGLAVEGQVAWVYNQNCFSTLAPGWVIVILSIWEAVAPPRGRAETRPCPLDTGLDFLFIEYLLVSNGAVKDGSLALESTGSVHFGQLQWVEFRPFFPGSECPQQVAKVDCIDDVGGNLAPYNKHFVITGV